MGARRDEDVPARDGHDVEEGEDERGAEEEVRGGRGGVGGGEGGGGGGGEGGGGGGEVGVGDGAEGAWVGHFWERSGAERRKDEATGGELIGGVEGGFELDWFVGVVMMLWLQRVIMLPSRGVCSGQRQAEPSRPRFNVLNEAFLIPVRESYPHVQPNKAT